jgi:elongation factor Ts
VHGQIAPGLGKIGVIVGLESKGKAAELETFGRQLAMHIAAANPIALDLASVPAETISRERAILVEKNQGKPEKVLDKIMESGLKSFAKENCLLDQSWVHDAAKTVTQALGEAGQKAGAPIKVTKFVRMQLGEGIDKGGDDFAEEVAKLSGG